ncbi:MAG: signal peptidase II, partial [bacterium]
MAISFNSLINNIKYARPMIIVTLLVLAADQITKTIVRRSVSIKGTIEIIRGFFEISYSENTGAVFGIFRGQNNIFVLIGIVAIIFIFFYYKQFKHSL